MELVDEPQVSPLILTGFFLLVMIVGSYVLVHLVSVDTTVANRYFWYMERAAGLTSYQLLSLTVLLGLSTTSTIWDRLKLRRVFTQVHQFTSLLVLPFIAVHLFGLFEDSSIPFSLEQLFVPLTSTYRPIPTTLGILTLYGIIVLITTSYFRPKLGVKTWRTIHYLSFPVFVAVTGHGFFSGTDSTRPWAFWFYLVPALIFMLLLLLRMNARGSR